MNEQTNKAVYTHIVHLTMNPSRSIEINLPNYRRLKSIYIREATGFDNLRDVFDRFINISIDNSLIVSLPIASILARSLVDIEKYKLQLNRPLGYGAVKIEHVNPPLRSVTRKYVCSDAVALENSTNDVYTTVRVAPITIFFELDNENVFLPFIYRSSMFVLKEFDSTYSTEGYPLPAGTTIKKNGLHALIESRKPAHWVSPRYKYDSITFFFQTKKDTSSVIRTRNNISTATLEKFRFTNILIKTSRDRIDAQLLMYMITDNVPIGKVAWIPINDMWVYFCFNPYRQYRPSELTDIENQYKPYVIIRLNENE